MEKVTLLTIEEIELLVGRKLPLDWTAEEAIATMAVRLRDALDEWESGAGPRDREGG